MLLQYKMNKINAKLYYAFLLIWDLPKTVTHTNTHRLSSLPSQCLLATASNPLHLSLVRSAGESAGLVRSIPGLTTSHMERRKIHRCPCQQHLGQLLHSHWSVWLWLQSQHFRFTTHSLTLTVWTQAEQTDLDLDPNQDLVMHSRVGGWTEEERRWKLRNTWNTEGLIKLTLWVKVGLLI